MKEQARQARREADQFRDEVRTLAEEGRSLKHNLDKALDKVSTQMDVDRAAKERKALEGQLEDACKELELARKEISAHIEFEA